jgi:hypothetical protein
MHQGGYVQTDDREFIFQWVLKEWTMYAGTGIIHKNADANTLQCRSSALHHGWSFHSGQIRYDGMHMWSTLAAEGVRTFLQGALMSSNDDQGVTVFREQQA